ncbi:hypothetical protein D3C85_113750 [compost metagenome]
MIQDAAPGGAGTCGWRPDHRPTLCPGWPPAGPRGSKTQLTGERGFLFGSTSGGRAGCPAVPDHAAGPGLPTGTVPRVATGVRGIWCRAPARAGTCGWPRAADRLGAHGGHRRGGSIRCAATRWGRYLRQDPGHRRARCSGWPAAGRVDPVRGPASAGTCGRSPGCRPARCPG